jgi:hypothetical protein
MQKLTEPITNTKTIQININYYPQTTNPVILSGSMPEIGRLVAHHKNSTTNDIAHARY